MTILTIVVSDTNTENDEDMETDIPVSYLTCVCSNFNNICMN